MKPRRLWPVVLAIITLPLVVACGIGVTNVRRRLARTEEAYATTPTPGSIKEQLLSRRCDRAAVLPMIDFSGIGVEPLYGDRRSALYAVCDVDLAPHLDCRQLLSGIITSEPLDVDVNTGDGWECSGHVSTDGGITVPPRGVKSARLVEMLRRTLFYR